MTASVVLIAGCALVTAAMRSAGPVALGGRDLPLWFTRVIVLLSPALLAALIVTQALATGSRLTVDAKAVGVAVAGIVAWRVGSVTACVIVAAVVTAALRAV